MMEPISKSLIPQWGLWILERKSIFQIPLRSECTHELEHLNRQSPQSLSDTEQRARDRETLIKRNIYTRLLCRKLEPQRASRILHLTRRHNGATDTPTGLNGEILPAGAPRDYGVGGQSCEILVSSREMGQGDPDLCF